MLIQRDEMKGVANKTGWAGVYPTATFTKVTFRNGQKIAVLHRQKRWQEFPAASFDVSTIISAGKTPDHLILHSMFHLFHQ
jgi:hypothetical protein